MSGIEVTPELRAAVYAADCQEQGHIFDVMVANGPSSDPDVLHGRPGSDGVPDTLPHLLCRRCRRTWLILADAPGAGYDDAEQRLMARLPPRDALVTRASVQRSERRRRRADGRPGPI